jgi:putative transposase
VQPRRRRGKPGVSRGGTLRTSEPNEFWSADYKGQFRTLDGKYCYPLTIQDSHTRFLLACDALLSTRIKEAQLCFERVFREYGLPQAIRTDNGTPFASATPLRLTLLSAWWIKLGITPDRSRPGCPQDNGRHERMHRELTPTRFPPAQNQQAQQLKFDAVREELDYVRKRSPTASGPCSSTMCSWRGTASEMASFTREQHLRGCGRACANGALRAGCLRLHRVGTQDRRGATTSALCGPVNNPPGLKCQRSSRLRSSRPLPPRPPLPRGAGEGGRTAKPFPQL